ncbi:hypothetical protein H4R26_004257 [Coemansia thaxteri]|uniref:Endonuclease/exonuclease/phosphatase domain-containing protein n=1 Tax=Coemansia thaxteri TaxID=2663907 RepID=A0A9W8BHH1_9FUNG|nr:hypothetical protein H4R26_004257 [Coemansia thaxteri]
MPKVYDFIAATPGNCYKLVSYNVNSLQAACKKGFKEYLSAENPDVICLQETKANQPMAFLVSKKQYPFQYWHCSKTKKGYAGTAVFSKIEPARVSYGLGASGLDTEGRVITLEFGTFHFVACYVPNAGEKLVRLARRVEWDVRMGEYLTELEATKPVVYAGDLNVAHHEIDLARPDTNRRSAGFTVEERDGFTALLGDGEHSRIDAFRKLHPEALAEGYTYFGYRANCREKSVGWRLDYFVVSRPLMDRVIDVIVRNECYGASDHVPIALYLEKADGDEAESAPASSDVCAPQIEAASAGGKDDSSGSSPGHD